MVIDQHALHERILYEQLRERMLAGAIETQSLLVPEPVDLSPAEAAAALEHRELLAQLGMKVEPFGGDTVLVAGYPAMLANMSPAEVLRELVEQLLAGGKQPDRRDLLDELLHTIACKAAIKAGDRLAPEEIAALLEQRHLVDDAHHCPHGRPTALVFTPRRAGQAVQADVSWGRYLAMTWRKGCPMRVCWRRPTASPVIMTDRCAPRPDSHRSPAISLIRTT